MVRIREWMTHNPRITLAASLAVIAIAAGFAYVQLTQAPSARSVPPAVSRTPAVPPAASATAPAAGVQPGQSAAPGSAPVASGSAPASKGAPAAAPADQAASHVPAGTSALARDPFAPLVQATGPGATAGSLPPVPPLAPGGSLLPGIPGTGPLPPATPPPPSYRLAGIVTDDANTTALAILVDGQTTRVVTQGDVLPDGSRILTINPRLGMLELDRNGTRTMVTLAAAGARLR